MRLGTSIAPMISAILMAGAAMADPVTLTTRMQEPGWASRIDTMFGAVPKPDWLGHATESEPVAVTLDGKPYTVLLACKQHDCGNHQFVVLFDDTTMYGLRFETEDNSPEESLTWLGIGGGAESIDGKTILYAAITGSLFNHPQMFAFPAGE